MDKLASSARSLAQGRRMFVYAVYAERHGVVRRLTKILPLYGSE